MSLFDLSWPESPADVSVVVIVDDQVRLARALEKLFRSAGIHAVAYVSGAEALAVLPALCPKLILLDLHMPTPDGAAVLQAIREDKTLDSIPVLIHTSDADPATARWAIEAGAQGLIVKGAVGCEELVSHIQNMLGGRGGDPTRLSTF
jgi:CheY-like chemotaxis protein